MMRTLTFRSALSLVLLLGPIVFGLQSASAQAVSAAAMNPAPEEFIRAVSTDILERIRPDRDLQAGDSRKVSGFVDETVMPNVDFERMTALAVGRYWRQASPEQQKQLMAEFRLLLVRTYSGALASAKDVQVRIKPQRAAAEGGEAIVRSEIVSPRGEPIQLDYRVARGAAGWRIYDFNVAGVWLVEAYRNQFAQEISSKGIDGLIRNLSDRNRQFAQAKS